ncbi:hypothetical protein [Streptomyces sp. NPDC015125]|uniref:hypothetical protein n=1 Tax=Streptomyces sp. NPDC015125 TaxID=3364938 RepID=UPI0037019742
MKDHLPESFRSSSPAELDTAKLKIVSIHIRYARARVGRWIYDGKVTSPEGESPYFSYTDRRGRDITTTRFTPLELKE